MSGPVIVRYRAELIFRTTAAQLYYSVITILYMHQSVHIMYGRDQKARFKIEETGQRGHILRKQSVRPLCL